MKMNFCIFKNDHKETEKQPDYNIVFEGKKVGAGWIKVKEEKTFISCLWDDEYKKPEKTGWDSKGKDLF